MKNLAPIILFVYNRPWHTKQTVEALKRNELAEKSELFIYSDGAKKDIDIDKVKEVRDHIHLIDGFKKVNIIERDCNFGLANNIIDGVTECIDNYGRVIVIEDDLSSSPFLLRYMNNALNFYGDNKRIFSISAFNLPPHLMKIPRNYTSDVYFNPRNSSWGWATWLDRWLKVDWLVKDFENFKRDKKMQKMFNRGGEDLSRMLFAQMNGKIDSWAIRWCYCHSKHNAYSVYPVKSYINNIGHDGSGIHSGETHVLYNDITKAKREIQFIKNVQLDNSLINEFCKYYRTKFKQRCKNLIKRVIFFEIWRKKIPEI